MLPRPTIASLWRLLQSAVAAFALLALGVSAQADPAPEDLVKAAVVFKLTRYVDWPEESFAEEDSALRLCVLGETPVADALQTVEGRVSKGRVVNFIRVDKVSVEAGCHVLYVAEPGADLQELQSAGPVQPGAGERENGAVLTISDIADFAEDGGIVELTRRGSRLGFRVNVQNARKARLVISAPLLELAEIVE